MKDDYYEQFDQQTLRDMCGEGELRYPASADKATLISILEDADFWDEVEMTAEGDSM